MSVRPDFKTRPILPGGIESPVVDGGFDPGRPDRKPKPGIDRSIPDSRMALKNEARALALRKKNMGDEILTPKTNIID